MSFAGELIWSFARSAAVAAAATALAAPIAWHYASLPLRSQRRRLVLALLAILLTPPLLTGYAYANLLPQIVTNIRNAGWESLGFEAVQAWCYPVLAILRWHALAVGVLCLMPAPAMSDSGWFLLRRSGVPWHQRLAASCRCGRGLPMLCAWVITFLFAIGEFEIASLLKQPAWNVWILDAQVGGMPTGHSIGYAVWAVALQLMAVLVMALLLRHAWLHRSQESAMPAPNPRPALKWISRCTLLLAMLIVVWIPLMRVVVDALPALPLLVQRIDPWQAVGQSILLAGLCTAAAMWIASLCIAEQRVRWIPVIILTAIGLLGSLVLALSLQTIMQLPILSYAYDTPLPVFLALTLSLLPFVIALQLLRRRGLHSSSQHSCQLLAASPDAKHRAAARRLRWLLRTRGQLGIAAVLFLLAYFDLTSAAILRPTGMETAPLMLYNQMHFGHNQILSAMLLLTILSPLTLVAIILGVLRFLLIQERE